MAATGTPTPNIGLRIPIGTDPASVDDINYNSNILDTKLGPVGSDSVQDQLDTLNGKLTRSQGTLTPLVTPTRADVATCYRNGGCCTIYINNVSFGSSFSSDTAVFRCPYIPPVITRFQLIDSSKELLLCFVDQNNGDVKINGYTAGRLLYGSVTFVV